MNGAKGPQRAFPLRKAGTKFLVAIGFDSQDVEYLDLHDIKSGWRILSRLPLRYGLSGASLASFGDKLFIAGGVGAGGILKAVKRLLAYDIRTNEWMRGPNMNFVSSPNLT